MKGKWLLSVFSWLSEFIQLYPSKGVITWMKLHETILKSSTWADSVSGLVTKKAYWTIITSRLEPEKNTWFYLIFVGSISLYTWRQKLSKTYIFAALILNVLWTNFIEHEKILIWCEALHKYLNEYFRKIKIHAIFRSCYIIMSFRDL